jgi:hypothetical protein
MSHFSLQLVGVPLSLIVIYLVGGRGGDSGEVGITVILLGKYSLFGYISQIGILQILAASLRRFNLGLAAWSAYFVMTFALTIANEEVIDRIRARRVSMDRLC